MEATEVEEVRTGALRSFDSLPPLTSISSEEESRNITRIDDRRLQYRPNAQECYNPQLLKFVVPCCKPADGGLPLLFCSSMEWAYMIICFRSAQPMTSLSERGFAHMFFQTRVKQKEMN
ncbi:uncharacterized protein LOC121982068 [Zingiber officinale]|uniref:uncharacterized protein LOC121982068 n=1 Tax=Zingiber officinale TaxID=94328 RepID=UPI001C4A938A|nr:uncharacterized protein LOC121982068 [Zingiber officinale]